MIIILTWYGKRGDTFFFNSTQKVSILVYQKRITLLLRNNTQKKPFYTVFSPGPPMLCHPQFPDNSKWNLISYSTHLDTMCVKTPPVAWIVDDLQNTPAYVGWPAPSKLLPVNYFNGINFSLRSINPNKDASLLTIDSTSFMFIADTSTLDSLTLSRYLEKIDILIISGISQERANYFRTALRPRFCVTTTDADNQYISNVVHLDSQCSILELTISNKKIVTSVHKACK